MSVAEFLAETGGKSFKFDTIGATVTGVVVSAEVVQKKNFDTQLPETWEDGSPVQQVRINLQTPLRDPQDPEDDGIRSIYIKGWGDQKRELVRAIRTAGAKDIEIGGTFTATYTGDGEIAKGKRGFPPKVYAYQFVRPSGTAALIADEPAATTPPTLAAATLTPEQAAAFQQYLATQQPT